MNPVLEDMVKLLVAIVIGGIIGAERESRDKAAGFRTIIFICVGATLFTIFSLRIGGDRDPARIAAGIVTGIGFLGAGAILRDAGHVKGLTTAATIWLAAGLGMGIGGGYFLVCAIMAVLALIVLWAFAEFEAFIGNVRDTRTYEIVSPIRASNYGELEQLFTDCGLRVINRKRAKSGEDMICTWNVHGARRAHECVTDKLMARADVREFKS
jgi:putative Mg2+ transporter-C (MgtC) family protein